MKIKWLLLATCCAAVAGTAGMFGGELGGRGGVSKCDTGAVVETVSHNYGDDVDVACAPANAVDVANLVFASNLVRSSNSTPVARNSAEAEGNTQLLAYLTELNGGAAPTENTFSTLSTLTFDGTVSATCNLIETIDGLEGYNFASLTKIEIKNMSNLTSVDLNGLDGARKVFPNLKTIIVDDCANLSALTIKNNAAVTTLQITDCPQLVLDLPTEICKTVEALTLSGITKEFSAALTFPKVEALEINNVALLSLTINAYVLGTAKIQNCSKLLSLEISASELRNFTLQNNQALQKLDLTKCVNIKEPLFDQMSFEENGIVVERNLVYAPDLRKVFLDSNDWITDFDVSRSPKLDTLTVTNCTNLVSLALSSDLSELVRLDLTECRGLQNLDIFSAVNLTVLSLSGCNLLKGSIFENIDSYSSLQYLNLSGTGVQAINFENFNELQILLLGSAHLESVALNNLPKLYQFEISESTNIKSLNISTLPMLTTFNPQYCEGIEEIYIAETGLESFKISGKNKLKSVELKCLDLFEIYVYDSRSLTSIEFSECVNLKTIEIKGCDSLSSESLASFEQINLVESVTLSECASVYSFTLENKPNLMTLDLKNLNSLTSLTLSSLGQTPRIYLPSKMNGLRNLTLTGLMRAQFDSYVLDLSKGVLSAIRFDNVPFARINLNSNMLASISISNVKNLQSIDLSNNKISNIGAVMTLLAASDRLSTVNLNNNRIDFSKGSELKNLKEGIYADCVVLGVQNVIANNKYTYEPKIYYGGMGTQYANIRAVLYYSNVNYKISEISEERLKKFTRSNLVEDRFKTCSNGTYYIVFEKFDDKGNAIAMNATEKTQFEPVYFTVSKEFDFIKFIWIIFVGVAGLIFAYVGVSWLIERKRKARLLGDDELGGNIIDGGTKLTRKEIKQAEREHRRMFKESEKLDKQERKNKEIADKERAKLEKENAKEQKRINAESARLAKIVEKGHKKEEKERLKAEKQQAKLDKMHQKLMKSRNKPADNKEQKTMKTPEEKAKDKQAKKEQKKLKRLEKENLKAERMREKEEERELVSDGTKLKIKKKSKTQDTLEDDDFDVNIEFPTMANAKADDKLDDAVGLSDKDLEDILASKMGKGGASTAKPQTARVTPTAAPRTGQAPRVAPAPKTTVTSKTTVAPSGIPNAAPKVTPKMPTPKLPPKPKA